MKASNRFGVPLICSVVLHLALVVWMVFSVHTAVVSAPAPVAVELWSSAPPPPSPPSTPPQSAPPTVAPPAAVEPSPPQVEPATADIQLARHQKPKKLHKQQASQPRAELARAPRPKAAEVAKSKLLSRVKEPVAAAPTPSKGKKTAQHYEDDTNDLLADLNSSNTSRPANARSNQAGTPGTAATGVVNGSATAHSNYAAEVQNRVRPLVQLPPDLSGNPKAVVQVLLWPTLEIRAVKLLQSSGNPAYDDAVQRAIWQARTFPALPAGASFAAYRQLNLEFRPK